jgi:signal peptidase II
MRFKRLLQLLFIVIPIFGVDYVTKNLTDRFIPPLYNTSPLFPYGGVAIFQNFLGIDFSLNHVSNKGAAWGAFSSMQELLLSLRIAVVGALIVYVILSNKLTTQRLPLSLVIAGALGNIVDYFVYGHVIDMFHFVFWKYSYPVFNVADISIFCGIVAMLYPSFGVKKSHAIIEK